MRLMGTVCELFPPSMYTNKHSMYVMLVCQGGQTVFLSYKVFPFSIM